MDAEDIFLLLSTFGLDAEDIFSLLSTFGLIVEDFMTSEYSFWSLFNLTLI